LGERFVIAETGFEGEKPATSVIFLRCATKLQPPLILKIGLVFGLCTCIRSWLPSSLLEGGFGWVWLWLKLAVNRHILDGLGFNLGLEQRLLRSK
jgi:hypothetical protein